MINRKRMYQQAGKKSRCVYRWVTEANRQLSIQTSKALIDLAVLYNVDCIVFEHLDSKGKIRGRKYRERIHLWRKNDVQKRVELQAHRLGMRISRICAWGTSKYAFDGSGIVDRHSVYHFEHGEKVYNYSLCTFQTGKIDNCDLSAAQNIGARQPERAKRGIWIAMGVSLGLTAILFAAMQLIPGALMGIFTTDAKVVYHGVLYLRTYSIDTLMVCFVFCLNGFFSGCGHTGFTMFNCLFSTFLVRLPLVIWFSTLPGVTMLQIGIAAPLASLVQIIIQLIYYRTGRWSRAVVQMENRT